VNALQAGRPEALPVAALLAEVDVVVHGQAPGAVPTPFAEKAAPALTDIELMSIEPIAQVESVAADEAEAAGELEIAAAPELEIEWPSLSIADDEPAAANGEAEWPEAPDDAVAIPARLIEVAVDESLVHFDDFRLEPVEPAAHGLVPDGSDIASTEPAEPHHADEVCLGSFCLSSGLYEIFMAEAHQRLTVLQEETGRSAELAGSTVSEPARRAVHTLAGIAGTAGITALAGLSHALEQYWNRFVRAPLPPAHLPLVRDTVARLHEMIATIENGQLPETAHDLIAALGELEDEQAMPAAEPLSMLAGGAGAIRARATEITATGMAAEPSIEAAPVDSADATAAAPHAPGQ
jgi:chemosensory pili system protein ChpA (sensor histidine kinase/response regulator)